MESNSRIFKRLFILISILIPMVIALLIFLPKGGEVKPWVLSLPFYNAIINTLMTEQAQKIQLMGVTVLGNTLIIFSVLQMVLFVLFFICVGDRCSISIDISRFLFISPK